MSRFDDMDRGRTRSRYDETGSALSAFYRERFGSQSPDEYLNLRISQMDKTLQREEIKEILFQEFKRYTPFEIKVVRNPGDDDRLAYVNFEKKEAARKIRHTMLSRLQKVLGRKVLVDPAGIMRDQDGKYIPDRYNRQNMQDQVRGSRSRLSPRRSSAQPTWRLTEDDEKATRSLFVGNMPVDIHEQEIRRVFERYGPIEEIDIKRPENTNAAYAFVQFANIMAAVDAKHGEHDRALVAGGPKCKIGYGKSQVSRRLWVGGLGPWVRSDDLSKEFDRYGPIEKLEYEEGSDHGYITYADVNAASDACRAMRTFDFDDHPIQIDFAKDDSTVPRKRIGGDRDSSPISKRRLESPPPTGKPIRTIEQLDEQYAFTWQGQILLKKSEYPVRLYRVAGEEKLLQTVLRDSDGNAVKLHVMQRLALASQGSLQEKLLASSSKHLAIMIGVGKDPNAVKPFANYLVDKDAAGVVTINDGILYIFAASEMATRILARFAPHIHLLSEGSPNLLLVLGSKSKLP